MALNERFVTDYCAITKLLFLLCLFVSTGTQAATSWSVQFSSALEKLLRTNPEHLPELKKPTVVGFYAGNKYKPLWLDADGLLNRADDLLNILVHADDEGLKPSDYYLEDIKKYRASTDRKAAVHLELLLSAALYRYSSNVYSGRFNPHDLGINWHISNKPLDDAKLFSEVSGKTSITALLDKLPPRHFVYRLLKKQLRRYRDIEQQGGWLPLAEGPVLHVGIQNSQVVQLKQRLAISGDLTNKKSLSLPVFDDALVEAVKHFQLRQGLVVDGKVGPQTRHSLNIPVRSRIKQIQINMERWRWMPRNLGKKYLMVNLAGFKLYLLENNSVVMSMPVIIGKAYRSTPSFSGLLTYMEYNPYWTVPRSIALKDILPRQIRDPHYLASKSIHVFSGWGEKARQIDPQTINWRQLNKNYFPYWLRQDPGSKNALGRVKFLFSNPYAIYLHGTPEKYLFNRRVRTFSSGCIRVKDPVQLAAYLLNDGSQQIQEKILQDIFLASNQSVKLPVAIPIYLVYWTAWVDQGGSLNFRHDVYGRDARLQKLFDSK